MSIAKGSKSKLLIQNGNMFGLPFIEGDASYDQWASDNSSQGIIQWEPLSFSAESMAEQIGEVRSDEMRSNRTVSGIRGGNIAVGGSVTMDFAIRRHQWLLRQLLAGTVTCAAETVSALATTTAYTRGQYIKSNNRVYLVVIGGTTGAAITGGLTHTSGQATKFNLTTEWVANVDTTPVYRYTITPGVDFPADTLSMEKQLLGGTTAKYISYEGLRVNTLALTIPQEGIVKADFSFVGTKSVAGTSSRITTPDGVRTAPAITQDPVTGHEAYLLWGSGQSPRPVKDGSLNITNSIDEQVYTWGNRYRRDVPEGVRTITGSLTLLFEDPTEYDYFKNEDTLNPKISFNRNGEYMLWDIKEAKLTGNGTPQISGAGVMSAQFSLSAFEQAAANDIIVTISTTADMFAFASGVAITPP